MLLKIVSIIFDWGDTLMRDFLQYEGPMAEWPEVELMPGVEKTLQDLSRGFNLFVASNAGSSDAELVEKALQRVGIARYFKSIFTGTELESKKPHLDFYRRLCKKIRTPPGECLMVGDNLEKDIIPARRIGMQAAWLSPEGGEEGDYWKIDSLPQVIEIVKRRSV